jgi:imidazolonepropionase-like amidohydrolase
MNRSGFLAALALALLPLSGLAADPPAPEKTPKIVAVRAGRLIDGQGGAPVRDAVILIQEDRVTAVGPGVAIPAGAEVIDLSEKTVLPGLIDCHTHLTQQPADYYEDLFRRSPPTPTAPRGSSAPRGRESPRSSTAA